MYIYKITDNTNGKIYIGLCSRPQEESRWYYGGGVIIKSIYNKRKHTLTKDMLEDGFETIEELRIAEQRWIKELNSTDPNIGYNLGKGGEFCPSRRIKNRKLSQATKDAIGDSCRGTVWYHNPETGEAHMFHEAPSSPWVKGRRPGFNISRPENHCSTRGTKMYHNPETGAVRHLHEGDEVPTGFIKGSPRKGKEQKNKGSKWYHNPETGESKMLKGDPPAGWLRGNNRSTSDETKAKLRAASKKAFTGKPQRKVTCPHCGKEGGVSTMTRHHFDNCKKLSK